MRQNTISVSTRTELLDAVVNTGVTPTIVQLTAQIGLGGAGFDIGSGRTLKFTSTPGNRFPLDVQAAGPIFPGGIRIDAASSLYLENIVLRAATAAAMAARC